MFDYFYGYESEQFAFIQVPRDLLTDEEHFGKLSFEAIFLYSLLLDRMKVSRRHGWFDEHNRVYIIFPIKKIAKAMRCGKTKVYEILDELDDKSGVGLITRTRRGQGKTNIIYVRSFIDSSTRQPDVPAEKREFWYDDIDDYDYSEDIQEQEEAAAEKKTVSSCGHQEVRKTDIKKSEKRTSESADIKKSEMRTSGSSENGHQEVRETDTSYNNQNKNNFELSSFVHSRANARAEPPNTEEGMKERKKKTAHLSFSQTLEVIGADWRYMTDNPPNSEIELRDWDDDQRETQECQIPYALRTDKRAMIYALRFLCCYSYYYSEHADAKRDRFYDILFSVIADMTARDSFTVKEQTVSGTEVIDRLNYIIQSAYLFKCLEDFKYKWDKVTEDKEISSLKGYMQSCFWEWLTEYVHEEDEDCGEGRW